MEMESKMMIYSIIIGLIIIIVLSLFLLINGISDVPNNENITDSNDSMLLKKSESDFKYFEFDGGSINLFFPGVNNTKNEVVTNATVSVSLTKILSNGLEIIYLNDKSLIKSYNDGSYRLQIGNLSEGDYVLSMFWEAQGENEGMRKTYLCGMR